MTPRTSTSEPSLAALILGEGPSPPPCSVSKIVHHFGDQPDVLEAIRELRRLKSTYAHIARVIQKHSGIKISPEAVKSWLDNQQV